MQQPSIYPRNVTQRIDIDPRDHVITQGQMYPQAFNQPAMFGEDKRVDPRPLYSPCTVLGTSTNPQLSSNKTLHPGVIQCPSGMPQQQIMRISPNTSKGRMVPTDREAPYIGAADNTSSCSVSFQSSSISNPNNVSLYSNSTKCNPVAIPVHESSQPITRFLPSPSSPPVLNVSNLMRSSCDILYMS